MTTQATPRRGFPLGSIALTAALTALATRKDLRERLAKQLSEAGEAVAEVAGHAYSDSVAPLAQEVGSRVQEVAHSALHGGGEKLGQLAEGGASLLQSGLEGAQTVAQQAVSSVQGLTRQAAGSAQAVVGQQARRGGKKARKAAKRARRELESRRDELSKGARRAAAQAVKADAGAMKRLGRLEARLEAVQAPPQTDPLAATLLTLGIVGVSGYLLARSPSVRQGILNAVRSVSPEAADALHSGGRQVRNIIGSVWLERTEPDSAPAPGTPRGGQGASAYAASEPGSDAAKRAQGEKPQAQAQPAAKAQADRTSGGSPDKSENKAADKAQGSQAGKPAGDSRHDTTKN